MGYPLRVDSATNSHAVTLKGHNSQVVFYDDEDRETFLEAINMACEKYAVSVAAWTFMSNHVHMIMHGKIKEFARFFQSVKCRYAKFFHGKYGGNGTLWKGRYHADGIETREEYAEQVQYTFNNPVKAGIADVPEEYEWSNFKRISAKTDSCACKLIDELANLENVLKHTREVAAKLTGATPAKGDEIVPGELISDSDAIEVLKRHASGCNLSRIPRMKQKWQRKLVEKLLEAGLTPSQIARVTGITRKIVALLVE